MFLIRWRTKQRHWQTQCAQVTRQPATAGGLLRGLYDPWRSAALAGPPDGR
jgi:hypothetical protein